MMSRGFTLVELMVGIVMAGVLSTALYAVLVNNQRTYMMQTARADLNATVRTAISYLPGELRELNAQDPAGSDIIAMTASSFRYKAMRTVYFACDDANVGGLELAVHRDITFGIRGLDPTFDSILVFSDFDPKTRLDDAWAHGNLVSINTGSSCPDGTPTLRLNITGISAAGLRGIMRGAPVRTFEVVELQLYQSGDEWWIGGRRYSTSAASWSAVEPIVGPLTATGLRLVYLDAAGAVTTDPTEVVRVGLGVTGRTTVPIWNSTGDLAYGVDSLVTQVTLRNNPRF